jgi:hypothetical protein
MEAMIGERARLSDLLVLGQFDTENPRTISAFLLPAKVVFDASAPILVIPNSGSFSDVGRHPLVMWDGSREAARGTHDAMPLLQAAEQVSVLAIDPLSQGHMHEGAHTAALVAHLGRHGVRAETKEALAGREGVTKGLLAHASSLGADEGGARQSLCVSAG